MAREQHCDVAVVGLGGAGAAAVIAAKGAGADVIAIERSTEAGGNTRDSGASIHEFLDVPRLVQHYSELTYGSTPEPVIRTYVEGVVGIPDWVRAHGGKPNRALRGDRPATPPAEGPQAGTVDCFPSARPTSAFPSIDGADAMGGRYKVVAQDWEPGTGATAGGVTLWQVLGAEIDRLGVPILYETRARRLLKDPETGAVKGVVADSPEGKVVIHARRGVILTTGGFASDPSMLVDVFGVEMPCLGAPGLRTGDGIRMAADVGADMWHMTGLSARLGYQFEGYEAGFLARLSGPGFVFVDQDAQRYVDETELDAHAAALVALVHDPTRGGYRRVPSYLIFDEETRYDGPIVTVVAGYNAGFPWSRDNSAEVKRGWIKQADTIDELAASVGLPADALVATVAEFNAVARGEVPDRLGRRQEASRALASPPYYAVELVPCVYNTQGGPRRNERAEVLNPFGEPIPGLYSAGELGSLWNRLYPGTGNLAECLVFGQIAGREAASRGSSGPSRG